MKKNNKEGFRIETKDMLHFKEAMKRMKLEKKNFKHRSEMKENKIDKIKGCD